MNTDLHLSTWALLSKGVPVLEESGSSAEKTKNWVNVDQSRVRAANSRGVERRGGLEFGVHSWYFSSAVQRLLRYKSSTFPGSASEELLSIVSITAKVARCGVEATINSGGL